MLVAVGSNGVAVVFMLGFLSTEQLSCCGCSFDPPYQMRVVVLLHKPWRVSGIRWYCYCFLMAPNC